MFGGHKIEKKKKEGQSKLCNRCSLEKLKLKIVYFEDLKSI